MQKIYNLLGVLGFVMSGTMAVMGVMAYTRVPSMVKNYASELKLELTQTILETGSYTHIRAHETKANIVGRPPHEKKKQQNDT